MQFLKSKIGEYNIVTDRTVGKFFFSDEKKAKKI
jgi:hypothetical protein